MHVDILFFRHAKIAYQMPKTFQVFNLLITPVWMIIWGTTQLPFNIQFGDDDIGGPKHLPGDGHPCGSTFLLVPAQSLYLPLLSFIQKQRYIHCVRKQLPNDDKNKKINIIT